MKKIAINRCWGGFSISPLAQKRLAELEGKECHFFDVSSEGGKPKYKLLTIEEANGNFCPLAYSSLEIQDSSTYLESRPEKRDCPNLIKVIEELGDAANGECAKIKIVEIPDDVDYEINDYDGQESVSEIHRSWY